MKKKIFITALSLLALTFFGCSSKNPEFTGYWKGDANIIFEVLPKSADNATDYIIRNLNGDLEASISNDTLRGKNSLNMEFFMVVDGDSAYYQFENIRTGYKRISQSEYEAIFKEQSKGE